VQNFEAIYESYKSKVYSTAYRMVGNSSDAEDVTQDVFVRIYKKLHTLRNEAVLSSWIWRITMNLCIDWVRKKKVKMPLNEEQVIAKKSDPDLRLTLEQMISVLPNGYKSVFILHDVEGLNHKEISKALRISEGTSKSQLHRARLALRDRLGPILGK
jgi:RNA polymerase sigma-70 factor (ECF subfamily)